MNEQFYKTVCEKYVATMSKEMLFKIKSKIVHIFIEDKYIELKNAGKINKDNYKKYLDDDFSEYKYSSYKSLFNSVIKDEIAYDLNDLELLDENNNWTFYLTFEELKKIGYGYIIKDHFPLLDKYILTEKNMFDFFNYFTLDELIEFEESLRLYYEKEDIEHDKDTLELYSKSNSEFNSKIISVAEDVLSYQDFIELYIQKEATNETLVMPQVIKYFKENDIDTLKQYGADGDEGLFKLSSLYSEILINLQVPYTNISTEESYAGTNKYITTISIDSDTNICIETKANDDIEQVTKNLVFILNEKDKCKENIQINNYDIEDEIAI